MCRDDDDQSRASYARRRSAAATRRFGYHRLRVLWRRNDYLRKIRQLYREEGLIMSRGQKRRGAVGDGIDLATPAKPALDLGIVSS